jgi:hypothetical protein
MYMISEDPYKETGKKWCFHAHLNSYGRKREKWNTWDIYIYTMERWDDARTMVHLKKNKLPTFFHSF